MKKLLCIVVIFYCCTSVVFADELQGLSLQAKERVELQSREMRALGIPEEQTRDMLQQMLRNNFAEQNMVRARQVVIEAAKTGLPTEPVMSKAMEGMAKQAQEQQIIAAMENVRSRYAFAEQMARSISTKKNSIEAISPVIADSLAAGMQPADLEAVKTQLQTRTRQQSRERTEDDALAVQTMQTVRTMARLGIGSSEVADTINQALQNAYTHREMEQLRQQIATQSRQELSQEIANRHGDSIGKGNGGGGGEDTGPGSGGGSGSGGSGSGGSGSDGSGSGGSGSGGSGSGGSGNGGSGSDSSGSSDSGSSGAGGSGSGGSK